MVDRSGNVYMVKGNRTREFWRYRPSADSWDRMSDVPDGPSRDPVKGGSDMVFVPRADTDFIYLLKGYGAEFLRYRIGADRWETQPDAPVSSKKGYAEGSWLAYDGDHTIYCHRAKYHELRRFDIASGAWDTHQLRSMPYIGFLGRSRKAKDGSCASLFGRHIVALKGGKTQEHWCYRLDSDSWREKDTLGSAGSTGRKKKVGAGADMASCPRRFSHYALKGNKTLELWRRTDSEWSGRDSVASTPAAAGPACRPASISPPRLVHPGAYDACGRRVSGANAANLVPTASVTSAHDLRPGVYLVVVASGDSVSVRRVVVMR